VGLAPPAAGVEVRTLTPADLPAVAAVHAAAFPDSALTRLGAGAVRRYYAWQLLGPHHHGHPRGAFAGGRLVGFCFGGVYAGALVGFLRRYWAYLALRALLRPGLLLRGNVRHGLTFTAARLLPRRGPARTGAPPGPPPPPLFGILSIAAHPAAQGSGAARVLMDDAEAEARRRGCPRMHLTVRTDNARAVRFYEKCGWTRVPPGPAWAGRMEKALDAPAEGGGG
jgi:ribosomal protein S18 acetylase RimI-like enzyme